jgi:hypothetical protein
MSDTNKALAQVDAFATGKAAVFSTITGTSQADKVKTLNALANATPVSDKLDQPFKLVDFVIQAVSVNDDDGSPQDAVRTVLVDDEGNAYSAVSTGLMTSLQNITGILGHPSSWEEPLPVVVTEVKGRKGYRFMTIKLV